MRQCSDSYGLGISEKGDAENMPNGHRQGSQPPANASSLVAGGLRKRDTGGYHTICDMGTSRRLGCD
eukprot:1323395-Amorphochlora_amoeboformis.AAC.1